MISDLNILKNISKHFQPFIYAELSKRCGDKITPENIWEKFQDKNEAIKGIIGANVMIMQISSVIEEMEIEIEDKLEREFIKNQKHSKNSSKEPEQHGTDNSKYKTKSKKTSWKTSKR